MKKALNKKENRRMNLARLVMNLAFVALFGFLNAFMIHNYGNSEQVGETDGTFLELQPAGINLEMTDSRDIVEYHL